MRPIHINEGLRMLTHSMMKKIAGIPQYKGTPEQICSKIINKCWNGTYFQTSAGHFCEFYTRDFSWCTLPLIKLHKKERVQLTLEYAMKRFAKCGAVTVAINPNGRPFDYPNYAVDSVPYLMRSLVLSDSYYLIDKYHEFLETEVDKFFKKAIEQKSGLVKRNAFSSAKDHSKRESSCYDNCMAGMLSHHLDSSGLSNPLAKYDYPKLLTKHLWKGNHFVDDLTKNPPVTGDANVFPYWSGVINDKNMMESSLSSIRKIGLDKPIPLKYSNSPVREILAPNYQGNTIWSYLGMIFIDVLSKADDRLALYYLVKYNELIKKNANFLELYNADGSPYKTALYVTDDSMLWASMYLELIMRMGE